MVVGDFDSGTFTQSTRKDVRMRRVVIVLVALIGLTACNPIDVMRGLNALNIPAPNGYVHPNPEVEQWHHAALVAGWTEDEWPVVACIMQHPEHTDIGESMGRPWVVNTLLNDRSYGLMQLNTRGSLFRWYQSQGLRYREDLLDALTNMRFAKVLSEYNASASWADYDKWAPWRGSWSRHRADCFRMEGIR
jgi:hypothetical protein